MSIIEGRVHFVTIGGERVDLLFDKKPKNPRPRPSEKTIAFYRYLEELVENGQIQNYSNPFRDRRGRFFANVLMKPTVKKIEFTLEVK